jgi:hypothetical protein
VGALRPGLRAQRVMLYSLTGHVLSSLRAYWDLHRRPAADRPSAVTVPTAFAPYPADKWSPRSEVWSSELSHSASARSHRAPD